MALPIAWAVVMRRVCVVCCGALVVAGCVPIKTTTTYSEELVERQPSTTTVEGSRRYYEKTSVDGEELVVKLRRDDQCETTITPIYHKIAHEHHEAEDRNSIFHPKWMAFYAAALIGGGIYSYADAQGLADQSLADGTGSADPGSYQTAGIVLGSAGVVLAVIAAIDANRLADDDEDLGNVSEAPETSTAACHAHPVSDQKIALRVRSADAEVWSTTGITDGHGVARVPMAAVPEMAFSERRLQLTATIGDDASLDITLSEQTTSSLLDALAADADSKVAHDRDEKARASCQQQVDDLTAARYDPANSRDVTVLEQRWQRAHSACGDKWLPDHDAALARFHDAVAKAEAERRAADCHAFVEDLSAQMAELPPATPEAIEQAVTSKCQGVDGMDKLVADLVRQQKEIQAASAKAQYLAELEQKIDASFQSNDAAALLGLTKDKDVRAAMIRLGPSPFVSLAQAWVHRIPNADARQLCASRSLLVMVAGTAAWGQLRASSIKAVDPVTGSRIAQAMDGCK